MKSTAKVRFHGKRNGRRSGRFQDTQETPLLVWSKKQCLSVVWRVCCFIHGKACVTLISALMAAALNIQW